MADVQIIDLDPKLSVDGTELIEIQEDGAGGPGTSFYTPLSNLVGPVGPPGDPGDPGADGADGQNATADAGTTTTLPAGNNALVTNSGTTQNAVFDFDIPRGDKGETGEQGLPGADSTVPGPRGDPGNDGSDGLAATIVVGTTTTLAPGVDATVVNVGSSSAAVFDFGIPEGEKGASGAGTGDVVGPAGATDNSIAAFDGGTGTLIKDGGILVTEIGLAAADVPIGGTTGQVLSKTSATNYDLQWTDQTGGGLDPGTTDGAVLRWEATGGVWQESTTVLINDAGDLLSAKPDAAANTFSAGLGAGETLQDVGAVAIGANAGNANQGRYSISYGYTAAQTNQGDYGTALGYEAGQTGQGTRSVAIGMRAGQANQGANGVIISSSGVILDDTTVGHIHLASTLAELAFVTNAWTFTGGTVNAPAFAGDGSAVTNVNAVTLNGSADTAFATSDQGNKADTALQPGQVDNVSELINDAGYKAYFSAATLPDPAGYAEGDLFLVTGP